MTGFGTVTHPVSSTDPRARQFFEQGLALKYGFNRGEAIRSFECAALVDQHLAMAHWGIALALGSDVNGGGDVVGAHKAISDAIALNSYASASERAYIDALARRYVDYSEQDRTKFEADYSEAMRALAIRYPRDLDAVTLYAESRMNLRPFQLWSVDGRPAPGTQEIVATLEAVLRLNANHLGANHLYIHAVEGSTDPGRSLPSAKRLRVLAPSSGHLVHMPAHVYFRIGDYAAAIKSSEDAIVADRAYLDAGGDSSYGMHYEPHNLEFLAVAYSMAGNLAGALRAVSALEKVQQKYGRDRSVTDPLRALLLARFGRWRELTSLAEPSDEISHSAWHFARGMAYAAGKEFDAAQNEAAQLAPRDLLAGSPSTSTIARVAQSLLLAAIAQGRGARSSAIDGLKAGIKLEDDLPFDEPPRWYIPLREKLGALLLMDGNLPGAERVFREDLLHHPNNGRSLFGLAECLKRAGKSDAQAAREAFLDAWRGADTELQLESF